uniref:Cadherin domain-containing protein n=1 Tax=Mola mola TaxID=94237 RepID=A0A3Q3X8L9_MOLML
KKREWITAPRQLKENHDYTGLQSIARIRSDKENHTQIMYFLSGPGVDETPKNVFGVDRVTGFVKIYSILDREKIAFYYLQGIAKYADGSYAEKIIGLNITVVDENDCPPVIKAQQVGSVNESSATGTVVMKVIATDDDQVNTLHTKIFYSIVEQANTAGFFRINSQTGDVTVQRNTLDREKQDTYKLTIKAADLDGRAGGNTGTGEILIKILDINDNIPTLEKESYEGSVEENTINVEVLKIKAIDMDLIHTDNWLAVFKIISGNEAGYFSITTDSKTNEGIIMIRKALDYEELKVVHLEVTVSNKAQYNFGSGSTAGGTITQKSYTIKINVVNQKEGPRFQPSVKVVIISEDQTSISLNKIITRYAAIDTDTLQTVTDVRYAKIRDDDNWLIIDEKTADIKLNKLPDRESKFLVNGTYYAKIICITNDHPSKTATGTIAIQVEDYNDHCPTLTTRTQTMCYEDNFVYVTAIDQDEFPNAAPFDFTVIQESNQGNWKVEPLNETTVILRGQDNLWPGNYKVTVEVKDQQGKSCTDVQVMEVIVCACHETTKTCVPRSAKTTTLGASGYKCEISVLVIPLLLLFCLCGGAASAGDFKPIPYDTKQQLISYHTEGQGEDKKSNHAAQQSQQKDSMLIYDYEGQESLAGSVGCCSLLENDNDLSFLNDLGPKFKTLAEICQGSTIVTKSLSAGVSISPPRSLSPVRPSTSTHTHVHTHRETIRDRDRVDINTLNTSKVAAGSFSTVQEKQFTDRTQGLATTSKIHVQDNIMIPSQTMLVQQPTMFYAATPMYVVEPNPQVVLVAGGTQQAVGQVGVSQGLVQVSGLQGSQGVVLVDRQVGGLTGKVSQGLIQGTGSGSRQVWVENGSSGGGQAISQGFVRIQQGSAEQGLESRIHSKQVKTQSISHASTGLNKGFAQKATPKVHGSQKVVVQHKKVSLTERNVESSSA